MNFYREDMEDTKFSIIQILKNIYTYRLVYLKQS
jgi:hypothetical protein